jgi:signal recognition particle subunit SEC65
MNKFCLLFLLLQFKLFSFGQITTTEEVIGNGLVYPKIKCEKSKKIEMDLNGNIKQLIDSLSPKDFCLGSFGFIQKNNFLQFEYIYDCTGDGNTRILWFYNLSKENEIEVKSIFRKDLYPKLIEEINKSIVLESSKIKTLDEIKSFYFLATGIEMTLVNNVKIQVKWEAIQKYILFG